MAASSASHSAAARRANSATTRVRRAQHAGSWYSDDENALADLLARHLGDARSDSDEFARAATDGAPGLPVRGIIAPHAGYSYSARTAAYAYMHIDPDAVDTIFILGPSHHVYLDGCAISSCTHYETPLGDLTIDNNINQELLKTGQFTKMSIQTDEDEHSIEMHLPILHQAMSSRAKPYTIVPILVGSISNAKEALYGNLLAPYLLRKNVFFIISSDFCHWGSRFRHTPKSPPTPVHEHIEAVDRAGMRLIEALDTAGFADYLRSTKNTICGRHPIAVFLHAIATARDELSARGAAPPDPDFFLRFVHYEQSSRALSDRDSSVSYASAVCRAPPA